MSRRAIVLLTLMAAISVACTGVVWAQDSGRTLKPRSASQKSAESGVIPNRYIVVLEDDGRGETAAQASADRRQAGQVADDLIQEDKVQEVSQTYGAALKGFAAEIPTGQDRRRALRSPRSLCRRGPQGLRLGPDLAEGRGPGRRRL